MAPVRISLLEYAVRLRYCSSISFRSFLFLLKNFLILLLFLPSTIFKASIHEVAVLCSQATISTVSPLSPVNKIPLLFEALLGAASTTLISVIKFFISVFEFGAETSVTVFCAVSNLYTNTPSGTVLYFPSSTFFNFHSLLFFFTMSLFCKYSALRRCFSSRSSGMVSVCVLTTASSDLQHLRKPPQRPVVTISVSVMTFRRALILGTSG
mmetsp:Transcript_16796/g.25139  ORF Transcript_16796/g.25139 Transcript_16796/m.25139 type:complete len:210 (+) Transcript_16796:1639-2268(+)